METNKERMISIQIGKDKVGQRDRYRDTEIDKERQRQIKRDRER